MRSSTIQTRTGAGARWSRRLALAIRARSTNSGSLRTWRLNANSTKSLQINNVPVSPLTAGSYTAKAVCSVDGINWVPIVIGYNNCATEVPFIVTSSNGIDDINATHCHVFAHGRNIVVTEADNMPIRVVDIMGRVVYGEKNCGSNLSIPIQKSGIYLVKIGNEPAQKIIVR